MISQFRTKFIIIINSHINELYSNDAYDPVIHRSKVKNVYSVVTRLVKEMYTYTIIRVSKNLKTDRKCFDT